MLNTQGLSLDGLTGSTFGLLPCRPHARLSAIHSPDTSVGTSTSRGGPVQFTKPVSATYDRDRGASHREMNVEVFDRRFKRSNGCMIATEHLVPKHRVVGIEYKYLFFFPPACWCLLLRYEYSIGRGFVKKKGGGRHGKTIYINNQVSPGRTCLSQHNIRPPAKPHAHRRPVFPLRSEA